MATKAMLLTQNELEALPYRSVVAFAARCAKRVLPRCRACGAPTDTVQAVEKAVQFAEEVAARTAESDRSETEETGPRPETDRHPTYNAASLRAALLSGYRVRGRELDREAAHAAQAADYAAKAAVHMAKFVLKGDAKHAAKFAAEDAVKAAIYAHYAVGDCTTECSDSCNRVCAAMRRDYDLLVQAAEGDADTASQAVFPEFFGPLWPEGLPEGWVEQE